MIQAYVDSLVTDPIGWILTIGWLLVAVWVYLDARARGSYSSGIWAIASVFLHILALAYYLGHRSNIGGRPDPASKGERILGTFVPACWFTWPVIVCIALIDPSLYHLVNREPTYLAAVLVFTLLPSYWLVWLGGWKRIRIRVGWLTESERERWVGTA